MGMFVVAPAAATPFHPSQQVQNHESLIPLLATAPCFNLSASAAEIGGGDGGGGDLHHRNRTAGIHLWQNSHQQQEVGGDNYPKKTINFATCVPNSLPAAVSGGVSGGVTCQDCGNQAKKDCVHRRCRTCCRSRGFDCDTHVKSTWVPAARRRERHSAAVGGGGASSGSTSGAKRPRLISSAATTTSHTSNSNTADTGSSRRDTAALPREVKAPAVFRCVRVTAVDGGDDEFAYQAVVKIGGHVFKGFLYDQGLNNNPKISQFHSAVGGGGGRNGVASSSPMIIPMELYGGGGGGIFLGGSATQYGNPIN